MTNPSPDSIVASHADLGAIEQEIVDSLAAAGGDLSAPRHNFGTITYNSYTDEATVANPSPEPIDGLEPERIPDTGFSIDDAIARLNVSLQEAHAVLAEVTFDPATGKANPKLQGEARARAQARYDQVLQSAQYDHSRLVLLAEQRDGDEVAREAKAREQLVVSAYVQGDRARQATFNEEMARLEAQALAKAVNAARRYKA